jgi:hypothetical protein
MTEPAPDTAAHDYQRDIDDLLSDENLNARGVPSSIAAAIRLLREHQRATVARARNAEARVAELEPRLLAYPTPAAHRQVHEALGAQRVRADYAEAELDRYAKLRPIGTEWSTANTYADPDDEIVAQALARLRVAKHPDIHKRVLSRQIYAGPWMPDDTTEEKPA